jgi:acyl carrier protein
MNFKSKFLNILNDYGVLCDSELQENSDIDLRDYIVDSLQFIGLIVEIETQLNIELDDELLLYDNLASLNGFVQLIESSIVGNA